MPQKQQYIRNFTKLDMKKNKMAERQQNVQSHQKKQKGTIMLKQQFQKAFDEFQCQQFIKNALDDMGNFGYDFSYSSQQPFVGKKKQMLRNSIYLRFNCHNCQSNKKQKRFTSTMGSVSIWFQFQKLNQKRKDPWLLVFSFQIYRMKCQTCGKYGQAQIYDSQLEKIQKQFCKIVADILNKIPPKKRNRNKNPIKVPDLRIHKHQECQACKLGKCHKGKCI